MTEPITVEVIINESVEKVWDAYTEPEHITQWAFASDDWHAPRAENDLRAGGKFNTRMVRREVESVARSEPEARRDRATFQQESMRDAKDGSAGFDFSGTYDEVVPRQRIAYTMDDGRTAAVLFEEMGNSAYVKTIFDPESENSVELQRAGWQAILNNFKKYVEAATS